MDPGGRQATNRPEPHKFLSTKESSKEDYTNIQEAKLKHHSHRQKRNKHPEGERDRDREREKKKKLKTKIQNIWIVIGRTNMDDKY